MKRKGDLPQATLIGLIILLIGAALLFIIFTNIPFKVTAEKESCRQSVLQRGKTFLGVEPGKALVPLNCKTNYIDIYTHSESLIQQDIANAMYDCWWELGEGRLQFWDEQTMKEFGLGTVKSTCMVCSIIRFDQTLKDKNWNIDVTTYLEQTKVPISNQTYLEYFLGEPNARLPTNVQASTINTGQDYMILFMAIEGNDLWEPIAKDVGIVAGGFGLTSFIAGPKTAISGVKGIASLMSKGFTIGGSSLPSSLVTELSGLGVAGGGEAVGGLTVTLGYVGLFAAIAFVGTQTAVTAYNQAIVLQHCESSRKGCMQIMLLPLNADTLANTCGKIESIP